MQIRLINDAGISDADFATITKAVQEFVPMVLNAWGIGNVPVLSGGNPEPGDWLVYCTDKNRHLGAAGYHTVAGGVPISYCSPKASGRLFGKYIKPLVIKGKTIHGAFYTTGLVTTLCHEIAEMLCDPFIKSVSPVDAKNRKWLVEVCDHVFGSYRNIVVDGKDCIIPDVTTPAFYDLNAKGPYSIFDSTIAPFIMTPKGYAYWVDEKGLFHKV
jgi:hypothetical protein